MTRSLRWLKDEIALRMMQKLEVLKHQPQSLLIVPDEFGKHARMLQKRFMKSRLHSALEPGFSRFDSLALRGIRSAQFIKNGITQFSEISTDSIGFLAESQDMVFSNLWMQSLPNPKWAIEEAWRVLREGGLFSFSYLGPDTGKELRSMDPEAMHGLVLEKLPGAWDMHDVGDALVGTRFADPVMDMEYLHLEYESDALYVQDAQALGLLQPSKVNPVLNQKPRFLPKKMTLEVVYGHAWVVNKHLSKNADTLAFISPDQIKRKNSKDYK